MVTCPSCAAEVPADSRFCNRCGSPLALACPACGAVAQPGSVFCAQCGARLEGRDGAGAPVGEAGGRRPLTPPAPVRTPIAERRVVSVLFADLVGFTSFSEGRDAEAVREVLSRYFEQSRDVIERYGGTVEKFIGDAVMAVWGAPTAHEDDAERAVRAGLDLVDMVRALGQGLEARAGVLTGEAAVTIGASGQGMVAGDLVNTASRLQSAAAPGTVLVGDATERAASAAIAFEPAGEHELKGKALPVPAFRALRVIADRGGRNRSDALEAPFVGRDDELRLLKDMFHATSRERRVRLVSVTGESGIGKSRLAWEFEKYLDGLVEDVNWHHGRSPSYGEGVTFWALGEMVRGRAGLAETDNEATTRARVAETLARFVPDDAERRWLEPRLLALLGIATGGQASRDDLFAAWRTFFERVAAEAPVVLVFEDLHWADPGLLDFIDHLLDWSKGVPIYVVTLARPELLDRRPDWGAGRRSFLALGLSPLPDEAMRDLLLGLAPTLPAAAVRAIVERSGGVPLYAVETVRMLVAEGRLVERGGRLEPRGDLTELAVPESLHAVIAARLDALDPADRALLQDAAVLGQSFTVAGLAAVSGIAAAELEPRLRGFVRRELLVVQADPRSPEVGQYAFVQALIREVASATFSRRDRRARHLAAARYFEGQGEELVGAYAAQCLAAWRAGPDEPDAQEVAAEARRALRAAAARATGLGSHAQAQALIESALSAAPEGGERARLLLEAGTAAARAGDYDRGEEALREAADAFRELDDTEAALVATAHLLRSLRWSKRVAPAMAVLDAARAEFAPLADRAAYLEVLVLGAFFAMLEHRPEEAVADCDAVLPRLERGGHVELVGEALVTRGNALAALARPNEARAVLEGAVALGERCGSLGLQSRALAGLGMLLALDDPRATIAVDQAAMDLARRTGDRGRQVVMATGLVEDQLRAGMWDEAEQTLDAFPEDELTASDRSMVLTFRLQLDALRGRDTSAMVGECRRLLEEGGLESDVAEGLREGIAWALLADGRLAEAADGFMHAAEDYPPSGAYNYPRAAHPALWIHDGDRARAALDGLVSAGSLGRTTEACRTAIEAGILALEGEADEAVARFADARSRLRELGVDWEVAATGVDMAFTLDPARPEVAEAAAEAREILTRLGAAAVLRQLDAVAPAAAVPALPRA